MDKQVTELVHHIFTAALELPPAQRPGFVAHACRDSPELQALVEALLLANGRLGSFLDKPLIQLARNMPESGSTSGETRQLSGPEQPAHPEGSEARFRAGETLSGRFIVIRFIARGGMGEVYEVEDTVLQSSHVALKTILPHAAPDPTVQRRFQQEVLLARTVTHAHLCPIYDIFHCEEPPPSFSFLTMKLLSGETLSARLLRSDVIPPDEAMIVCRQLISAVSAIHAAGITHGDITPKNVIIDRVGQDLHIWLTDFGLARLYEPGMTFASTSGIAGTPGYLAPELLKGHRPSKASDIFALGVVLHRIFYREMPTASDHLRTQLGANGVRIDVAQVLADFLADDPKRRCSAFARAQLFTEPKSDRGTVAMRPRDWPRLAMIPIALLLVLVAASDLRSKLGRHPTSPRTSVIVTEFDNRTEDGAFDQTPRELISVALSQSPQVSIFPSSRLPDMLRMMQMPETAIVDEHVGDEICTREGLQFVIAGAISKLGKSDLILVKVLNCNGDPVSSTEKTLSGPEQLPATIDEIAARIRHGWGESKAAIQQASQPLALVTSTSLEAIKLYSSGRQELYLGNYARANTLFKSAVEMDESFAMAHEYLAISYAHLNDDDDRAAREFASAVQLSGHVTERERQKILADSALFQYDIASAMPHYQILAALSPDDPAVHLNLAECYREAFRFDLAISEVKKAIELTDSPSPLTNLAIYYYLEGETQQAIALAQQVTQKNPESAKALNLIGTAYLGIAKQREADSIWGRMLPLGGSAASMARASMADAARTRDDLKEAALQLQYAVNADYEAGNTYDRSKEQIDLADVYRASGRRAALRNSLHDLSEPSIPELIYFLGRVYAQSGGTVGAERAVQHLEKVADRTPRVSSYIYMLQSEIAVAHHRPEDAIRAAVLAVQNRRSPLAIETLAKAYEAAGKREEAAQQYELLLARSNERQFDSADSPALYAVANARYHLGILYQLLDRDDLATQEFKMLLAHAAESQHTGVMYADARERLDQIESKSTALANQRQRRTEPTP